MSYTEQELKTIRRKFMYASLIEQIECKNHFILSKLWEMLHIDNSELVKIAHTLRNIPPVLPHNMIFYDMARIIYEKSDVKDEIVSCFYELLKKLEPNKVWYAEEFIRICNTKGNIVASEYLLQTHNKKADQILNASEYFVWAYRADINVDENVRNVLDEEIADIEYAYFGNDAMYSDDAEHHFNSNEKIFDSGLYRKYLRKRKEELIEFLCMEYKEVVTEENLYDFIAMKQKSRADKDTMIHTGANMESSASMGTASILIEQYGGKNWYSQITNDGSTGFINALGYSPNIESIVEIYYKEYIKQRSRKHRSENKESISKIYLSRECVPTPREAYIGISYLYNIDVVCKLFNNIKDEYYRNFSWEKITQNSIVERYSNIIADLEAQQVQLKNQLETENVKHQATVEILRKELNNNDRELEIERIIGKMTKTIDEQKDEILALKKQLENKEEYIQMLLAKEDNDVEQEIDISVLQSKRYLFVGFINEALPELKKRFPNSIFMDSESSSLQNIKVDAIVMLIKYMSHGMYYKVCSSKISKEVPIIHCNTKNINTIYNKMLEII